MYYLLGLAAIIGLAGKHPVWGRPLIRIEAEKEIREANEQLRQLQEKIAKKELTPVEFEVNKYALKPHPIVALEHIADLMFRFPNLRLIVRGHTCDIGSAQYNLWLSQKRAEAIRDHLMKLGVPAEHIRAKGYGESQPLYKNEEGESSRAKNRRVEFVITTREWDSVY